MINQQLLGFIKKAKAIGQIKEQIKAELLSNGWNDFDIEEGFKKVELNIPIAPNIPTGIEREKPKTKKHIGLIVAIVLILAIMASSYFFKDKLSSLVNKESNDLEKTEMVATEGSNQYGDLTKEQQLEQYFNQYCISNQENPQCIFIEAVKSHDVTLCNSITDMENKYYCIEKVDPSKITSQLCDSIPLYAPGTKVYSSGVNVYNGCYSRLALQSYDSIYCKKAIDVMRSKTNVIDDTCLLRLAEVKYSPEFCTEMGDTSNKVSCLRSIAFKTKNIDICNMIENQLDKKNCELYTKL